jgi:ssDNA-binding Zn-finger/Zn-ribbon topoisomerase 1
VDREKTRFKPTPLGAAVSDLLTEHFANIMDMGFTSGIESKLDSVAEGNQDWVEMLKKFFGPFEKAVEETMEKAERVDPKKLVQKSDEKCEGGDDLVIRSGRYGKFLSCGRFPECRVSISTRPGERASGEVKENWEIVWKTAMEKCAIVHPEAAAAAAAEAEAKRGSRKKSTKKTTTKKTKAKAKASR